MGISSSVRTSSSIFRSRITWEYQPTIHSLQDTVGRKVAGNDESVSIGRVHDDDLAKHHWMELTLIKDLAWCIL